jgi:uncharacterized membrane protein
VAETQHGWTDQQMDQVIGNLLRAGVLLAAAIVLLGAVLYLTQEGTASAEYGKFNAEPPSLESLRGIAAGAARLEGKAVIQLGLVVLLATPVARVVLLVFAFGMQRDRFYVVVTLLVLMVLAASITGIWF